ncbi:MAG: hypothetical protein U1G07_25180 [Verrucomicrobiota bacterium]
MIWSSTSRAALLVWRLPDLAQPVDPPHELAHDDDEATFPSSTRRRPPLRAAATARVVEVDLEDEPAPPSSQGRRAAENWSLT